MSKLFTLNNKDFLKGLIIAVLVSAITIIQQSLELGTLVFDWKAILIASISGGLAYLMKNFFTTDAVVKGEIEYTTEQLEAIARCENILSEVNLELVGTRPKDR